MINCKTSKGGSLASVNTGLTFGFNPDPIAANKLQNSSYVKVPEAPLSYFLNKAAISHYENTQPNFSNAFVNC